MTEQSLRNTDYPNKYCMVEQTKGRYKNVRGMKHQLLQVILRFVMKESYNERQKEYRKIQIRTQCTT